MIDRSKYRKLRKAVTAELVNQAGAPFIAITRGQFTIYRDISSRDVYAAWPYLSKDLGLVDDCTHTDTWTLPGRGFMDHYQK